MLDVLFSVRWILGDIRLWVGLPGAVEEVRSKAFARGHVGNLDLHLQTPIFVLEAGDARAAGHGPLCGKALRIRPRVVCAQVFTALIVVYVGYLVIHDSGQVYLARTER